MINKITVNNFNTYGIHKNNTPTDKQQVNFGHEHSESDLSKAKKGIVLASSALGMAPVLAVLAKKKGFSLNPAQIIKTPVKDWAIFKYSPINKSISFEAPQIIAVATGSVAGGFVGGTLVDEKSNRKAKLREVLNQILGNVLVPVGCVGLGSSQYDKYANRIKAAMPQINKSGNVTATVNKCLRHLPNLAATFAFLGVGLYLGNKVSNFINEKIYHKKVERNIKATDFAPHVDDLCMATTMMNKESVFASKLARVIPLALLVPGYQTGIAQEKHS